MKAEGLCTGRLQRVRNGGGIALPGASICSSVGVWHLGQTVGTPDYDFAAMKGGETRLGRRLQELHRGRRSEEPLRAAGSVDQPKDRNESFGSEHTSQALA